MNVVCALNILVLVKEDICQEMTSNKVNVFNAQPDLFQIALIRIAYNVNKVNKYYKKMAETYVDVKNVTRDLLNFLTAAVKDVITTNVLLRTYPVFQINVDSLFVIRIQLYYQTADANHVHKDQEQILHRGNVKTQHAVSILVVKMMANAEQTNARLGNTVLSGMEISKEHANNAVHTWLLAQTEDHATNRHAQTPMRLWVNQEIATLVEHRPKYLMTEEAAIPFNAHSIPDANH